jgi:serine/threonine protein kinase
MPKSEYESQLILAKIVKALKVLDERGIIHGNISAMSVYKVENDYKIGDFK